MSDKSVRLARTCHDEPTGPSVIIFGSFLPAPLFRLDVLITVHRCSWFGSEAQDVRKNAVPSSKQARVIESQYRADDPD